MSVDEKGSDASEQAVETLPVLRREAIIVHQERGRIATLVAVCSLLGVALGFSLSTMAAAMQAASASSHHRSPALIAPSYEGRASPTWLGVTMNPRACMRGALVTAVHDGSPAAEIGLRAGDVIVSVDGVPVRRSSDLVSLIQAESPGSSVAIGFQRDGERQTQEATLGTMPRHVAAKLR